MIGSAGPACVAGSLRRIIVGGMMLASAAAAQPLHANSVDVVADLIGLPAIGKWLIAPDLAPANWLRIKAASFSWAR